MEGPPPKRNVPYYSNKDVDPDDYEEVMDHLKETDFDPEEMQKTALLLR